MRVHMMIATVQCYIHIRKGVEVVVSIPQTREHLMRLIAAYQVAKDWMAAFEVKMEQYDG